ncbi:MAG: DUF3048 domain-containing protein [Bacillota bacterium]
MLNRKIMLLVALMTILLIGCNSNNESSPNASESPVGENPSEETGNGQQQEEEEDEVKEIFPLTGTPGETATDKRPFAVVINNDVKARPQSGLHKADIVYEVLAEGDITRLLAIFQSQVPPDSIGPVRSARSYFIDLAKGYDPIFVFHGWSPGAREKIVAGEVDGINGLSYDGTLFKRASFRVAPHNSYITYDNIEKGSDQLGYSLEQAVPALSFHKKEDTPAGDETDYVKITYSKRAATHVEYSYKESDNHYVRSSGEEKNIDLDTSEDIVAHNIFIVESDHQIVDDAGRREIDITSGGRAILIQNGVRQEVEWKEDEGRILPYLNGSPVPFTPGKTWIQIVPDLTIVSY